MRSRLVLAGLAMAIVFARPCLAAVAADASSGDAEKLRSVWEGGTWGASIAHGGGFMSGYATEAEYLARTAPPPNPVPLNAAAQKNFDYIRDQLDRGRALFAPYGQCHPAGMPYLLAFDTYGGFQAVVGDREVLFLYGTGDFRRIRIGAPGVAKTRSPATYNGDSSARWEGGTWVIETSNIRGENTVVEPDIPKGPGSRVVERYTPVGPDRLDVQMSMTNPEFTRPWVVKYQLVREPTGVVVEHHCTDGNRYAVVPGKGLTMHAADGKALEKAEE